jgi:tRNA A-37 threonylcarbamoyl transferase component Bud32
VSSVPEDQFATAISPPQRWLATRAGLLTLLAIVTLLLVAVGGWTYYTVGKSLRELRSDSMQGLLDAQVNSMRVWIAEELADANRIARDPGVRSAVVALVELAERAQGDPSDACASAERSRVFEVLRPLLDDEGSAGHNVISLEGRLLSTQFPAYCGSRIHPSRFRPLIDEVFKGRSTFVRPLRDTDRVELPPKMREGGPLAWVEAPVRDGAGRVRAVLGIAEPAQAGFSAILAAARPGRSGEVYAFDAEGYMLSESRFLQELQRMQLVPPGSGALLTMQVREPPDASQPAGQAIQGSLTRLAQAALAGRASKDPGAQHGVVLDPYRSYRGPAVVGVWRWLPEIDVGIAFEIEADEAYAPLASLKIAFAAVLSALVVALVAALGTGLLAAEFRRRFGGANKAGAYVIEREIGSGGMANIYLARHALLKRPTAVKIMKRFRATDEMVARFEREVQLASRLSHPNTVEIFDYGRTRDGLFYYAMEYLDGVTLAQLVEKSGPLPVARTIHILSQTCSALAEAHALGLVHRDIKPENIMVCRRGIELDVVKILDFGLVKNIAEPHSRDLTRSLKILGTPLYMAPERIRSPGDVDARTDLYSLGVVAYYLLTGRKLFESEDDLELAQKVLNDPPPFPSLLSAQPIPAELDRLVVACLAKRREDRPQSATEMLRTLERLAAGNRWSQDQAAACWE